MKINKIYISAFGKLKDYTLELDDGLNVIYGENEQGKSTIMAFIKMMFYGSGRGSSQVSKNPRIKYNPWSNDKCAGRIFFEHSGINYCLEREFLKSDSSDKIRLTNTDTGETKVVSSDIGSEFFGLSSAAFDRTVFIGQTGTIIKDEEANGEINSKLSNMVLTGDEDISFQAVYTKLNNAKLKLMSKSGKAGIYDKKKALLEETKGKLLISEEKENRKITLNSRIEEIQKEITALSEEYIEVKKAVDNENDIRNCQKLEEFLKLKEELDLININSRLSNGTLADESYLKKIEFCLSKAETAKQRLEDYNTETEKLVKSIEMSESKDTEAIRKQQLDLENSLKLNKQRILEFEEETAKQEELLKNKTTEKLEKTNKQMPFSPLMLISGLLLFAIGFALFFIINNFIVGRLAALIGGTIAFIGVIVFVLSFIFKTVDKSIEKLDSEILSLQSKIAEIKSNSADLSRTALEITEKLNTLLASINADKAVITQRKSDLLVRQKRYEEEKIKYTETEKELYKITNLYRSADSIEAVKELLPELYSVAEKQKNLKLQLKYLCNDLGSISYEEAKEKLNAIKTNQTNTDINFEEKRRELEKINEKMISLKEEYSSLKTELKTAFKEFTEPTLIKKEIESLEETLAEQKYFCDIIDIASEVLESSFIEIRRSYGSALEQKALEIFSKLTKDRYANVNISKSLNITVEQSDSFGTREIDYLSSGTIDQAYLSLRLALSELMECKEKLPIMLDDVLSQYDDKRTEIAINFLKEYSSNSQSVLFTCHNSICSISEKIGIKTKNL